MKIVATEKAPAALGPYSQGYTHGGMFYSAGQLGADPATGDLAEGIEGQADRACQNMAAVLEAMGEEYGLKFTPEEIAFIVQGEMAYCESLDMFE